MNHEGFVIDHVIFGVVDIDAASERLREEHGLGSVAGSPHLGGTNSRIVPLGPECFLELLFRDRSKSDKDVTPQQAVAIQEFITDIGGVQNALTAVEMLGRLRDVA